MRYLTLLILFVVISNSFGKNKLDWMEGVIKLTTGEQLNGNISYNAELDIVSFLDSGNVKAFTPFKVISFEYYDSEIEEKRTFVSVDFGASNAYKTKIFFEQLVWGKISLIRRYRSFNQFYAIKADKLGSNFGSYIYYAVCDGKFVNLKGFKKNLMPLLKKEYKNEMDEFLNKNNLSVKQIDHQLVIIDYYNFLSDPQRKKFNDFLVSFN